MLRGLQHSVALRSVAQSSFSQSSAVESDEAQPAYTETPLGLLGVTWPVGVKTKDLGQVPPGPRCLPDFSSIINYN